MTEVAIDESVESIANRAIDGFIIASGATCRINAIGAIEIDDHVDLPIDMILYAIDSNMQGIEEMLVTFNNVLRHTIRFISCSA